MGTKKMQYRIFVFSSVFLAFLVAISVSTVAWAGDVSWTGCGITKKAFMTEIAKAYEKKYGTKINLSGGGATKGIRSASAGSSEMGGTCRHCLVNSAGVMNAQEKDAQLTMVAWDALVAITHPDNPVDNISLADLKKIYDGKITSWKKLGGPDKRIMLVTRQGKSSGVGHMFRRLVFKDPDYEFKARSLKVKSSGPLEKKAASSLTALGVTGISSAKRRNVKILSIDGVAPNKENLGSGKYSLFRPLYLALGPKSSPEARKVLDFVLSDEGQKIVSEQGTVNLAEGKALNALWNAKKGEIGL